MAQWVARWTAQRVTQLPAGLAPNASEQTTTHRSPIVRSSITDRSLGIHRSTLYPSGLGIHGRAALGRPGRGLLHPRDADKETSMGNRVHHPGWLVLALVLIGGGLALALDPPGRSPKDKTGTATTAKPATAKVKKEPFKVELTLKGVFEA